MNIYQNDGWLNIPKLVRIADSNHINFIFIIGARRTGKTYGIFKHFLDDVFPKNESIVYMRRTVTQLESVMAEKKNPWIDVNKDTKKCLYFSSVKGEKNRIILEEKLTDGNTEYRGEAFALTTMQNNRGFSGSIYRGFL